MQSEDIRSLQKLKCKTNFFFVALWKLSVRIFFNQLNWAVFIRPDDADLMDAIEHPYLQDGCIVSALFVVLEQFKQQLYSPQTNSHCYYIHQLTVPCKSVCIVSPL